MTQQATTPLPVRPASRGRASEILFGGAVAGLIGGAAMAIFLMIDMGGLEMGFMSPFTMMAATFLGPRALVAGPGAVLLGVLIHVVFSAGWGILFAWAVPRDVPGGAALSYGLVAGSFILIVMTFLVLPWADPTLGTRVRLFQISWIFAHVLYGIGLAFAPALRRSTRA